MALDATSVVESAAERFVDRFAAFWRAPDAANLPALLMPDVRLVQPLSPAMQGLPAAQAEFRRLFAWLPDLRFEWPAVDRFTLAGDRARERVSYFDSLPLVLQLARAPMSIARWWRSGAARPWRSHVRP